MSDPTGQGNTPATPTFSGPEGYTATALPVKSISYNLGAIPEKDQETGLIKKGETPGSYKTSPTYGQITYKSPLSTITTRVGGEIRNPETEEFLRLGRLAKKEGFNFEINKDGKVEAEIPEEYFDEEEKLRIQLKQKEGEADILKELYPISTLFIENNKDVDILRPQLKDPATLAVIEQLSRELKTLIDEAHTKPEGTKLDEIRQKSAEFEKAVTRARIEVSKIPVPKQDDLQEKIQLQQNILTLSFEVDMFRQEARSLEGEIGDDQVRTLFSDDTTRIETLFESLKKTPEKDLKDRFDVAFEEYKKDIEKVKEFVLKNPKPASTPAPTTAPKAEPLREYGGWPTFDVFFRKQTKNTPGGWFSRERPNDPLPDQEIWDNESKAFDAVYRHYIDFIKNVKIADKQLLRPLVEAKNKVTTAVKDGDITLVSSMREEFEAALEEWQKKWAKLSEVKEGEKKFAELKKSATKVEANIASDIELNNLRTKQAEIIDQIKKAKDAVLNGEEFELEKISSLLIGYKQIIDSYEKTQQALSIKTKMGTAILRPIKATDKNRDQKIQLIDGQESTVGEYAAELEAKEKEANKVTLTEKDLADWPELRAELHEAGDVLGKKVFEAFQVKAKYQRMLRRNENSFLALYINPSVDPNTNEVEYTATDTLRKHPYQDVIKEVLKDVKGIEVIDLTRKEVKDADEKKKEDEYLQRTARGATYQPAEDLKKEFSWKSFKGDVIKNGPSSKSFKQEMSKETKISNQGGMILHEIEAQTKPVTMAQDLGNEPRPVQTPPAPTTIEQERKKQKALRKVNDIVKTRESWLEKNPKNVNQKGKLRWYVLAGAIAAVGIGAGIYSTERPTSGVSVERVEKEAEWREYFLDKEFMNDFIGLSAEQLAVKYAPLYAKADNTSSVNEFLLMEGYKLLNDPDRCYGLSDNQRDEACKFIRKLEQLSQAVDAPNVAAASNKGVSFTHPWNWYSAPTITIRSYIGEIKEKTAEADK